MVHFILCSACVLVVSTLSTAFIAGASETKVVRVSPRGIHDGDTLRSGNQRFRLGCIDAPEISQVYGHESRDALRSLIARNGGRIEIQVVDVDRFGRSLVLAWLNNPRRLVQMEMVRRGDAFVYEQYLRNCGEHGRPLLRAQREAEQKRLGVWSVPGLEKPWDYRRGTR